MTLVIVLLFGLGTVLIVSAVETDPATGKSVSVLQTIQDIWNNDLPSSMSGAPGGAPPPGGTPNNPGGPGGQVPQFGGSAHYDAYRAAVVQAYIQSQR